MVCSDAIRSWLRVTAGAIALLAAVAPALAAEEPLHSADLDAMIVKEAQRHGVPERLVRRVVMRESRYNPRARNRKYWGLMQISYPTARSMGFKGTPQELLNPLVNLTYAVPYLANAFIAAGKREDAAIRLYAGGYYDTARRRGLLGMMRTADSAPATGFHDEVQQAAAEQQPSFGIFGALLNPFDSAPSSSAAAYASTAPQDVAAAAAPSPEAVSAASPAQGAATRVASDHGKGSGGATEMVADQAGNAEPPKKWRHDGGVTVLARGEQPAEHAAGASPAEKAGHKRHAHKSTQFATLDASGSAQAYAPDPSAAVASQSAITDAIAPTAAPAGPATADAAAPARTAAAASADTEEKRAPKKKIRRVAAGRHRAIAARKTDTPAETASASAPSADAGDGTVLRP